MRDLFFDNCYFIYTQFRPAESVIPATMNRFRTRFTLADNTLTQRRRTVRTEDFAAAVKQSIEEDPTESTRHRANQLKLYPSNLRKILRKYLGLQTYKIQLVQDLKQKYHQTSSTFSDQAQKLNVNGSRFFEKYCSAIKLTLGTIINNFLILKVLIIPALLL